jgi:hypothetical protein
MYDGKFPQEFPRGQPAGSSMLQTPSLFLRLPAGSIGQDHDPSM